jgi:hypothetical protein
VWSPSGFNRTCAFGDLRREVLLSIGRWQARAGADDIAVQDIAEQVTVSLDGADLAREVGCE